MEIIKNQRPKEPIIKKKRLIFRLNRFLTNVFNFFYRGHLRYHALNAEESLKMLLKTKKSYIRFGDGESDILVGFDRATQVYDRNLRKALIKIIKDYNPYCNYLLGLSNWNLTQSVQELKATPQKRKYRMWRYMRYVFWRLGMDKIDMPFLETDMFRVGPVGLERHKIEKLWANVTNIIMIHNSEEYFRWFSKEYNSKIIYFITIPDKNFFSVLPETQEKIIRLVKDNHISKDNLVILVAAGAGAKVLCYNLCQKDDNYLCYDMGHFFHMHYHDSK